MKQRLMMLKGAIVLLVVFLPLTSIYSNNNEEVKTPVKIKVDGLRIRSGLPNFFAKIKEGDSIKVGYLGGSITSQSGWRVYSLKWLQELYPDAGFKEINAAIGGTGSDLGVYRLHDHVLNLNPDLIFVEFAVNDNWSATEKIICSMEGIVRQIWQHNPKTDICFIYTIMETFLDKEMSGELPASATAMETVAEKYGIPSINFGAEVCRRVKEKQLVYKGEGLEINGIQVFSRDGVHPYVETGHLIYQEVLASSFEEMKGRIKNKLKSHALPEPLKADNIPKAGMVDITKAILSSNWELFNPADRITLGGYSRFFPVIAKAGQTGETLKIRFKGKATGIFDVVGPGAARVIIEIDGIIRDTVSRFDQLCTYYRPNYLIIDKLEDTIHDVTFRVLSEPFDKSAILKKNISEMKNPEEYKNFNLYIGKILIDGEIVR
jgi:hypothetical protein